MIRHARLDVDRTAQPLTILTAPVMGRNGPSFWPGPAAWHIDLETGRRSDLGTLAHPYPLARCDEHFDRPEVNEGCGTITCQVCLRLIRGETP